jgi:hypothetical protein
MVLVAVLVILFFVYYFLSLQKNITVIMINGNNDELLKNIYKQDIQEVYDITNSKSIEIKYFEIDLNSDGYIDKIVTIQSPLHSGSLGDTFNILIGGSDNKYINIANLIIQIYAQNDYDSDAEMYVSKLKKNGYYNIIIRSDGKDIVLAFNNGAYEIVR